MKNNYFGYNIAFLRKSYRMNQTEFAKIVGKTPTAISRWENESREPSNEDIQKICEYFGIEPADLMFRQLDQQTRSLLTSDEIELLSLSKMLSREQMTTLIAENKIVKSCSSAFRNRF